MVEQAEKMTRECSIALACDFAADLVVVLRNTPGPFIAVERSSRICTLFVMGPASARFLLEMQPAAIVQALQGLAFALWSPALLLLCAINALHVSKAAARWAGPEIPRAMRRRIRVQQSLIFLAGEIQRPGKCSSRNRHRAGLCVFRLRVLPVHDANRRIASLRPFVTQSGIRVRKDLQQIEATAAFRRLFQDVRDQHR